MGQFARSPKCGFSRTLSVMPKFGVFSDLKRPWKIICIVEHYYITQGSGRVVVTYSSAWICGFASTLDSSLLFAIILQRNVSKLQFSFV